MKLAREAMAKWVGARKCARVSKETALATDTIDHRKVIKFGWQGLLAREGGR